MAVNLKPFVVFLSIFLGACANPSTEAQVVPAITVAADQWDKVLAEVEGKRVGCVVNHTSLSGEQHLVDRLLASGVEVLKVFAPEHGFRGLASDGERISDQTDAATGLPIISLYGKSKRPTQEMFADLDLVLFDIQDVGTRFYTYISTMHYIMDAGAEYGVPVLILDRPNPNGHYIDGPILQPGYESFIGMHPIPVVHGLTVGELARMINGEGWLSEGRQADLTVVPVATYQVGEEYVLPVRPSPNLPNQASIYLYPTLCFFEGTIASIGRGTDFPFQVVGHPAFPDRGFAFTPEARPGAKYAKLKGDKCYGWDLRDSVEPRPTQINWSLLSAFAKTTPVQPFVDRPAHFDACAGSAALRNALETGAMAGFRETYQAELEAYWKQAQPYLLYERNWEL